MSEKLGKGHAVRACVGGDNLRRQVYFFEELGFKPFIVSIGINLNNTAAHSCDREAS